jgi:hydrogenase nickel incorporation protein HypB
MCDRCGCGEPIAHGPASPTREIAVGERLLAANDRVAAHNRDHFAAHGLLAVNVMGTPGSGKTALLEATIRASAGRWRMAVVEGDQATARDRDRIAATGAAATQVETGLGCHLDARQVHDALHALPPHDVEVLFIENVGNLVCPALFDLGEGLRVVVTSPTEGADKPVKYPPMFRAADVVVLNKIDLLPHLPFDLAEWRGHLAAVNRGAALVLLSALTGDGLPVWLAALERTRADAAEARP